MAYVTVTNGASGQILGFDSNNASNVTINLSPDNLKTSVQTLTAALAMANKMAEAFSVDVTDTPATSGTTSGTTSGSKISGSSTVTSGGSAT